VINQFRESLTKFAHPEIWRQSYIGEEQIDTQHKKTRINQKQENKEFSANRVFGACN